MLPQSGRDPLRSLWSPDGLPVNATGLRDQLVRFYARHDFGSDGQVQEAFLYTESAWGRVDEKSSVVRTQEGALRTVITSEAEFDDAAEVPPNGVLLDPDGPRAWWIRGINTTRALRRTCVTLDRIPEEAFRLLLGFPASEPFTGTQLVDPL